MRFVSIICIVLGITYYGRAQFKREMRAVWIAHVNNIDFPASSNLTADQQKTQFINIVDDFVKNNINAAIVQIRTNCDASYPSDLEPWSAFWTGLQGVGPSYDPLQFMIDECHKRNIEFHAWFNPYRAAPSATTYAAENHVRKKHPEWILSYNGLQMLDPALPEVREYVTKVILDVVQRYDIDAVHFDDYFYPYPVSGVTLNDDASFSVYNRGFTNRPDWRRDNINLMVKMISDNIKKIKPWVKFGISPFGIWKNKSTSQPDGSDTKGLEAYHSIYADSRKWIQEGWVDYIAPQIYWSVGFSVANFGALVPWWSHNKGTLDRHLYIGHAVYRINNGGSDPNWSKPDEMSRQINLLRHVSGVNGSIFYNTTSFRKNLLGFNDTLQQNLYRVPAFIPTMPWIDSIPPETVTGLALEKTNEGILLKWNLPGPSNELDKVKRYAIYKSPISNQVPHIDDNEHLLTVIGSDQNQFLDRNNTIENVIYSLTALDRLHNESTPVHVSTQTSSSAVVPDQDGFEILLPFPNPFTSEVHFRYNLKVMSEVRFQIFDASGMGIYDREKRLLSSGWHEEVFDGSSWLPGVYYIVMTLNNTNIAKKIIKFRL